MALAGMWLALPLRAQTYHNLVNQKFRTVANGPQSALIVDVPDATNTAAVRKAAMAQFKASLAAQRPAIQQEIALMRKRHLIRPTQQFDYVQVAIARANGRIAMPPRKQTRSVPAGNDIKFNFPLTTNGGADGGWKDANVAAALDNLANKVLKPELKQLLGPPLWSDTPNSGQATVTVLNSDPRLGKTDEVIGALVVISVDASNNPVVQIQFPTFSDDQTNFLAMAQAMAQAFLGPYRVGYDAWAQGMARAAAVVAAKDISSYTNSVTGTVTPLDPTNGFYYTPYYDLENQPALGNNTFTPPTKSNQAFNPASLSGMLIPRLQMSSMAWLKCYIENPSFFSQFNSAYYDADSANVNTANDINALRTIAKSVLPSVEGQPFDTWYEQQYVLDTSVTIGPKLYAYTQPTFPDDTTSTTNPLGGGAAVFLIYYNTTLTSSGQGDESDLNTTVNPIYWDYNFANRLFPSPGSDPISIVSGFGSVAPVFSNIGGSPADQMRVTMDFPAAREYVRVPFPANQTGSVSQPNDYSGVLVGADSGTLTIQFSNGVTKTVTVAQGEFGGTGAPTNLFSRDVMTLTQTGASAITFQRNILHRSGTAAPIFKLVAPAPLTTLTNTFLNGPRMISLPIKPTSPDLATALGANPSTLLLAQYRQDLTSTEKYQLYPSLPTYQPGYGLWSNLNLNLASSIVGYRTDVEQDISVPLLFGWNQIGSPYNITPGLNVSTTDISFSYRGGDAVSLADAVSAGWVSAGITAYSQSSGYVDITSSSDPTVPQNTLEPWKGYWIRVLVTEGVTIIYSNPSSRSARAMKLSRSIARTTRDVGAWSVPLSVRDANGTASGAVFGQSSKGTESFNGKLDVASPPAFSRAATLAVRFPHADWDTGNGIGGDFLADIRQAGAHAEWNVNITVPASQQPYTLTWANTAKVPHGTRLTLVDQSTGTRTFMNTTSSYAFTPAKGELTRQFQIIAEPRSAGGLFIRNVVVDRPPVVGTRAAASAVIHYELSADAQTTVVIRMGGTVIRHLAASGRAAQAGVNELVWDLRNDRGIGMGTGVYSLEITAQTTEGERTRSILPIIITR